MRNIAYGLLLCLGFMKPVGAYNTSDIKQDAVLMGVHLLAQCLPDAGALSSAKFSAQFGIGVHNPALAAAQLGFQHFHLGDKTGLSSGTNMLNRAIAENFAARGNSTLATGYLVAAGLDVSAISLLSSDGRLGEFRLGLINVKLCNALINAVEHGLRGQGYSPEIAGLTTSAFTGISATMLSIAYGGKNLQVVTALAGETGFRLLPSMARMISPEFVPQNTINWVGASLIFLANRMNDGNMKVFTRATGAAFLIGPVVDFVGRLKRLVI